MEEKNLQCWKHFKFENMEARIVYTLQTYILYTKQAYSEPRATWAKEVLTEKQRAEQ